jgi:hypothetical protein
VQPAILPLRPLTVGELLDAAVALLRGQAKALLGIGLVLATVEQVVLYPLRAISARPPYFVPYDDQLAMYWLAVAVGFGTELGIITLLDGIAARAAGPALLGRRLAPREVLSPKDGRFGAVLLIAVLAGVAGAGCALAGLLPWFALFALVGLAVPALVIDRVSAPRAIWRSVVLSCRGGMRAAGVRTTGYLAWWAVRLGLGVGTLAILDLVVAGIGEGTRWLVAGIAWAIVNAVAYPALACLDAVLHLETRMRTEGLDIALSRAYATGKVPAATLVLPG